MKAQFWGVRGYVPTPGAAFLRYGGNTCCVSLRGANGELLVLDSGTGFCELGAALMAGDFRDGRGELTMLITHTYWDHFLGLPFPGIVHVPGNHLRIYGPDSARGSLEMIYDTMLAPVYSPVSGLAHIAATHSFHPVPAEPFQVSQLTVRGMPLSQHAHSPIWAYRVEEAGRALVYITDARYTDDAIWRETVGFARDARCSSIARPTCVGRRCATMATAGWKTPSNWRWKPGFGGCTFITMRRPAPTTTWTHWWRAAAANSPRAGSASISTPPARGRWWRCSDEPGYASSRSRT